MARAKGLTDTALIRRVGSHVRRFKKDLVLCFILDLLATPLGLLVPIPLKIAVDSVIGSAPMPEIIRPFIPDLITRSSLNLLLFAVGLQVFVVFCIQMQSLLSYTLRTRAGENMTLDFRTRLFHQVQRLSLIFHDTRGTTDSIYRIQYDAPAIQWLTIQGMLPLLSSVVMLVSMIYVIVCLNLCLALVALGILPLLFWYSHSFSRRMRPRYKETKQLESNALKIIQEVLTAIRVVKVFGRERDEEERFKNQSQKNVDAKISLARAEGQYGLLVNITTAVGSAAVLFMGVSSVQRGNLTVGELLMVITYLGQLYSPVKSISNKVKGMQSSLASLQRSFELLDELPEVEEKPGATPLVKSKGAVVFDNVTFYYDGTEPVLRNVSFSVPPGAHIGIRGKTGAGKSTLISLLYRLYDPQVGRILIDGMDVRDYKLADLRNQFAIMLQDPMLFSTSILENIAYGSPGADRQKIIDAAMAADAHEFIMELPRGYDTLVGERGMRLSGGERQRISLARAFLKDAPILILDEPTSSVDMGTEASIMASLKRLMNGRTTFIITHRLNMLENFGKILHLESGYVSETTSEPLQTAERFLKSSPGTPGKRRQKRIKHGH